MSVISERAARSVFEENPWMVEKMSNKDVESLITMLCQGV